MKIICDSVSFVGRKACKWLSCAKEEGNRLPSGSFRSGGACPRESSDHRASFCSRIPRSCQKARVGLRHDRFQAASDLALLYLNNGRLLLEPQPLFNLLEIALLRLCEGGTLVLFFSKLFFFCSKRGSPGQASLAPRFGEKRSIDCPFRIGSSGGNQKQGIRRARSSCRITSTLAQF